MPLPTEVDIAGDVLNAKRFLAEHDDIVRYAPELGRWFFWNGAWWEEDRIEAVLDLASQTIDGLRAWVGEGGDPVEIKRRTAHYVSSTRAARRDGMLVLARTDRSIVVAVKQLDLHPRLLACRNGTVDLCTGELRQASPSDLITRGVELKFDPAARSEPWESFLRTVFSGDEELIAYVQRLAGYAITGEVGEHVLPILHGTGANGKSTFVTAIQNVMGEHAIVGPKGLLVEQRQEAHEERLAVLRGRRLVVSSELEHRAVLAESLVKAITGGDKMSARHLYKDRFDFDPQFTIVLVTNYAPRVAGTDEAIWRRLRLVPFNRVIPLEDRIPDYGQVGQARWWGSAGMARTRSRRALPPRSRQVSTGDHSDSQLPPARGRVRSVAR
jgi:putative DNA primase/helicase